MLDKCAEKKTGRSGLGTGQIPKQSRECVSLSLNDILKITQLVKTL